MHLFTHLTCTNVKLIPCSGRLAAEGSRINDRCLSDDAGAAACKEELGMRLRVAEPKSVSKDLQPHCLEAVKGNLSTANNVSVRTWLCGLGIVQHTLQCRATYAV